MLKLNGVSLHYGSFRALSGIDLDVRSGELVVLLGANGAGKSSIFLSTSGLRTPTNGSISWNDEILIGRSPAEIVSRGIVLCPEGRKLFPQMSVLQNLTLGAYVHRRDKAGNKQKLLEIYDLFPILLSRASQAAGSLSGGQQQMVAIGRALMSRPKVLLLDEPSLGLAPLVVKQVFEAIKRINKAGTTVLLAEQNAYAALKIADRAYVLESGRIAVQGSPESLMQNTSVRQAYIGA